MNIKDKWSTIVDYFLLLGAIVGVGFASGKEIYVFFYSFEGNSIIGLILFGLMYIYLFGLIEYFLKRLEIKSYNEFTSIVFGKFCKIGRIILIVNFSITASGMLAASNYIFSLFVRSVYIFPALILSLFEVLVLKGGKSRLQAVANFIVPIMLAVIVVNSIKNITPANINLPITKTNMIMAGVYGLLFGLNNFVAALPVLVESKLSKSGKYFVVFTVVIIILLNILVLASNKFFTDMPMLEASKNLGNIFYIMYLLTLAFALFTTLMVCSQNMYSSIYGNDKKWFGIILVVIINLIVSNLGFDFIVGYLYLFSSVLSAVLIIVMIISIMIKLIKFKRN